MLKRPRGAVPAGISNSFYTFEIFFRLALLVDRNVFILFCKVVTHPRIPPLLRVAFQSLRAGKKSKTYSKEKRSPKRLHIIICSASRRKNDFSQDVYFEFST